MKVLTAIATCLGCACLSLLPTNARAEIVIAESVEWLTASSERVLVGKVINVETVKGRDDGECQAVTVAITKSLKGPHVEQETFLLPTHFDSGYAPQWKDEGIPIVFFLVRNDGRRVAVPADKCAWVLRDGGTDVGAVLLGKSKNHWTGCIPTLTRD